MPSEPGTRHARSPPRLRFLKVPEIPAPQAALDPSCGYPPAQVHWIDHHERREHGDDHVAEHGHRRRKKTEHRQLDSHPADVNGEEGDNERQRPAAVDCRACPRGRFDLRSHRGRRRLVRQPKLADDGLLGLGCRVDRCHDDVPRDSEDPKRAGDGNDPRQRPVTREHQQQHDGHIAARCERRQRSVSVVRPADDADRVADSIQRKPPGNQQAERLGRDEGGVDQEERYRHADHCTDRGSSTRRPRRSPQRMQRLYARRQGEQPSDAGRGGFRRGEGRHKGQQAEAQRYECQAGHCHASVGCASVEQAWHVELRLKACATYVTSNDQRRRFPRYHGAVAATE